MTVVHLAMTAIASVSLNTLLIVLVVCYRNETVKIRRKLRLAKKRNREIAGELNAAKNWCDELLAAQQLVGQAADVDPDEQAKQQQIDDLWTIWRADPYQGER